MTDQEQRIHDLERRLASRTRELEVLQTVQQAINRQLELQKVLQLIADQARLLTHCRSATVYLLEEDHLRLEVISGELETEIQPGYHLPLEGSIAGLAVREARPFCVPDARSDPRVYRDAVERSDVDSFLITPLISAGRPIGVISVANKLEGQLNEEDERILLLLASGAVISLENARLYEQAAQSAAQAERNRLARELHDAVTQSLFSASLIGDVLPQLWEEDPREGRQRLEELRRLTRGALAEMRTLLLELRPTALENAPIGELFRHLTNAFSGRTQIPVQLHVDDQAALPVPVKVAIYRIAQEALNNIGKHAEAENVLVRLLVLPGQADLEILDDGRGFSPESTPAPNKARAGLGLGIMQERAAAIGADLQILSGPDSGTQILFHWTQPEQTLEHPHEL